ncbi:hypothetical protein ACP4OV_013361 [Aristida adscensionis]
MEPEEVEAVLETIWDLHDKVSDAIHALSRAHFLRTVRRRAAGDKPAGLVYVKGGAVAADDGDEASALVALAEEARSLHAIRAALEDLEDQFECFLAVQSQQEAERDIVVARLEQSRIMLAIRLKEHHGKNHKVIDEASDFVHNVYQDVWPSLSEKRPQKCESSDNMIKDSNFLGRMVASTLALARNNLSIEKLGGLLGGHTAVLAIGVMSLLQLRRFGSGGQDPVAGNYNYRRVNQGNSSRLGASPLSSSMSPLDVSLAKG